MTEQINTNPTSHSQLRQSQNEFDGSSIREQSLRQSNLPYKEHNNPHDELIQNSGVNKQQRLSSEVHAESMITPQEENANENNLQDEYESQVEDKEQKHSLIMDQQLQIQSTDPIQFQPHEVENNKKSFPSHVDGHNRPDTSNIPLSEYQKYLQKEQEKQYYGDGFDAYRQQDYNYQVQQQIDLQTQIQNQIKRQIHPPIDKPIKQQTNLQITTQIYQEQIIEFIDDDIPIKNIHKHQTDHQSTNAFKSKDFQYTGIEQSHSSRSDEKKTQNDQTPISKNIIKNTPKSVDKQETVFVREIPKPKVIEKRQIESKTNNQKTIKDKIQIKTNNPQPIIKKQTKENLIHQTVTKEQELKPIKQTKIYTVNTNQPPIKEEKRRVQEEKREEPEPSHPQVIKAPVKKIRKATKIAAQERIRQTNKIVESTIKQTPPQKRKEQTEKTIGRDVPTINPPPPKPTTSTVRITVLSTDQSIPQMVGSNIPPLTSLMIVSQAVKQRIGTTYTFFLKYIFQYQKTVNYYKNIVQNVYLQIEQRKNNKKQLINILIDYFNNYSKLNHQFYERCYKIQSLQQQSSANKFENIKAQLKPGYEQLIFLRKSIANDSYNIANYITNTVNTAIIQAFQNYNATINAQQQRQINRRIQHLQKQTILKKLIAQIDKNFNRGLLGKEKNDIFTDIIKLINEERTHRDTLKSYGRGLIDLRQAYIHSEKELFNRLQSILNHFKTQSKTVYSVGRRQFDLIQDLTTPIKANTKFAQICNLTDLDYIRYVLQLQSKRQNTQFTNRHFEQYLDLVYFDKIVGNIKDLYKGATTKVFPMEHNGEQLVHTVSGNLVFFNRERDELRDKFVIKNINVKMIGQGIVEVDQVIKGILFDDNRTMRLKLRDADRAEELICYLNEKEENIVLSGPARLP